MMSRDPDTAYRRAHNQSEQNQNGQQSRDRPTRQADRLLSVPKSVRNGRRNGQFLAILPIATDPTGEWNRDAHSRPDTETIDVRYDYGGACAVRTRIKEGSDGTLRVDHREGLGGWVIAGVVLGIVVAVMVSGKDLTERTTRARAAAQGGQYDEAWQHLQLRSVKRHVQTEPACAQYSSGQVRQFFARTPCRSLERALLVVGTDADTIAISVAWLQMPSTSAATRLKQTLDKPRTGDIYPIPGRTLQLGNIRFTRKHYSSHQSETMVIIAKAERIRGAPPANLLDAVTQVAVALPPL